ncbi:MAG: lipoprotein [Legionella sp.]|nr:lipoprotein [Legionella sp.]
MLLRFLLLSSCCFLAACGQKGPLYLPLSATLPMQEALMVGH